MTVQVFYKSKKEMKENIGKSLKYQETSFFGNEVFPNKPFVGTNHPKRSFFAEIVVNENYEIVKVK